MIIEYISRKLILFLVFFSVFKLYAQFDTSESILKKHVYTLASDSLQGRATASIGQKKAAKYIANEFAKYGLNDFDIDYVYPFYLQKKHNNYAMLKQGTNLLFTPWHFHYVSLTGTNDTINDSLVFVGYGTQSEILGVPMQNKSVMLLANSPAEAFEAIIDLNAKYHSKTFLVVFESNSNELELAWKNTYDLQGLMLKSEFDRKVQRQINEPWVTLPGLDSVNVFYCFHDAVKKFYNKTDAQLFAWADSNINNGGVLPPLPVLPLVCYLDKKDSVETLRTENITGFIKGKDTTHTIVVTAHYDHLGMKGDDIFYGADDNASGTSALLEVARIISLQEQPLYNIQFIAFSGEELGLFGSKAYVENPIFPLSETVININMDMVGRWDERHEHNHGFVYLLSAGNNSEAWYRRAKYHAKNLAIKVSKNPGPNERSAFTTGSDHYSFYKLGIPVMVVFTGLHNDYHTVNDTPDKINYQNLSNISSLVARFIYNINSSDLKN